MAPKAVPALADADQVAAELSRWGDVHWSALVANPRGASRAVDSGVSNLEYVVSASDGHSRANAGRSSAAAVGAVGEVAELALPRPGSRRAGLREGDQRRIERQRAERLAGEAERAVRGVGGDDGDTGGEVAEDVAQDPRVDRSRVVLRSRHTDQPVTARHPSPSVAPTGHRRGTASWAARARPPAR